MAFCGNTNFQPLDENNVEGSTYGPGSRCLVHGRSWRRTTLSDGSVESDWEDGLYGNGCYRVKKYCAPDL